jgi:hypothetical protein
MLENMVYAIIGALCMSFAEFVWINYFYQREYRKKWPKELLLKEFLFFNMVSLGLSPILFCAFHFENVLEEKLFQNSPDVLIVGFYLIPVLILILIVDKYCENGADLE